MKNRIVIFGLLCIVMLSGCGIDENFKDEPNLKEIEGIVLEQEVNDTYNGTHILIDDAALETPLKSLSLNLSREQYLGNRVKLVGFLNPEDQVFEVTGISVLEILNDTPSENDADLIEYKNTDLGFQLKYYNNWSILDEGEIIVLSAPSLDDEIPAKVEISQMLYQYSPTINDSGETDTALSSYSSANLPNVDYDSSLRKIGVDGVNAIEVISENGRIDYYLYRNGLIYIISFLPDSEKTEQHLNSFKTMLSDFRFTGFTNEIEDQGVEGEPADSDNETINDEYPDSEMGLVNLPPLDFDFVRFESLPYSFSAKYPEDWYYAGSGSSGASILRHYGFSDETVSPDNELITLDVVSSAIPSGENVKIDDYDVTIVKDGDTTSFYTSIDGQIYRVMGENSYESVMLYMISSIESIELEEVEG